MDLLSKREKKALEESRGQVEVQRKKVEQMQDDYRRRITSERRHSDLSLPFYR